MSPSAPWQFGNRAFFEPVVCPSCTRTLSARPPLRTVITAVLIYGDAKTWSRKREQQQQQQRRRQWPAAAAREERRRDSKRVWLAPSRRFLLLPHSLHGAPSFATAYYDQAGAFEVAHGPRINCSPTARDVAALRLLAMLARGHTGPIVCLLRGGRRRVFASNAAHCTLFSFR